MLARRANLILGVVLPRTIKPVKQEKTGDPAGTPQDHP